MAALHDMYRDIGQKESRFPWHVPTHSVFPVNGSVSIATLLLKGSDPFRRLRDSSCLHFQ
jgi:hypothetical protein